MSDEDEVALNVLLAEGIDVPTAYAGSISDDSPKPSGSNLIPQVVGILCALLVALYFMFGR
jgi:hypothetical protein